MKISVIDYGIGNVFSVMSALKTIGYDAKLTNNKKEIVNSDRVILPGVGAFSNAVIQFKERGLDEYVHDFINKERPFLGICVGMQMLLEFGEEGGNNPGLGYFDGNVTRISKSLNEDSLKVPHIAWSKIYKNKSLNDSPYKNLFDLRANMYFIHSYHCEVKESNLMATCRYGDNDLTAAIAKDNILGTQFHPEKSGPEGLKFLNNFLSLPF